MSWEELVDELSDEHNTTFTLKYIYSLAAQYDLPGSDEDPPAYNHIAATELRYIVAQKEQGNDPHDYYFIEKKSPVKQEIDGDNEDEPAEPQEDLSAEKTWEEIAEKLWAQGGLSAISGTRVGIIGVSGAGKTAYLYVLGKRLGRKLGRWEIGAFAPEFNDFIYQKDNELNNWQKTPDYLPPVHLPMFRVSDPDAHKVEVESFDCGGEVIKQAFVPGYARSRNVTDFRAVNTLRSMMASCHGFIVIIDAKLALSNDPRQRNLLETEFRCIVDTLIHLHDPRFQLQTNSPIAVVLNKADDLVPRDDSRFNDDELGLVELLNILSRGTSDSFMQYEDRLAETRGNRRDKAQHFVQKYFPSIFQHQTKLTNCEFFGISCWGTSPDIVEAASETRVEISGHITPIGIEEPLQWILDQVADERYTTLKQFKTDQKKKIFLAATGVLTLCLVILIASYFLGFSQAKGAIAEGNLEQGRRYVTMLQWHPFEIAGHWLGLNPSQKKLDLVLELTTGLYNRGQKSLSAFDLDMAEKDLNAVATLSVKLGNQGAELLKSSASGLLNIYVAKANKLMAAKEYDGAENILVKAVEASSTVDKDQLIPVFEVLSELRLIQWSELLSIGDNTNARTVFDSTITFMINSKAGDAIVERFTAKASQNYKSAIEDRMANGDEKIVLTLLNHAPDRLFPGGPDNTVFKEIRAILAAMEAVKLVNDDNINDGVAKFKEAYHRGDKTKVAQMAIQTLSKAADLKLKTGNLKSTIGILDKAERFISRYQGDELEKVRINVVAQLMKKGDKNLARRQLQKVNNVLLSTRSKRSYDQLAEHLDKLHGMVFIENGGAGFYIDQYEVTNAEYEAYIKHAKLNSGNHHAKHRSDPSVTSVPLHPSNFSADPYDIYSPLPDGPVVFVNWYEAYAYAKYSGKRLVTEEEWEVAFGSQKYPWGNTWIDSGVNTREFKVGRAEGKNSAKSQSDTSPFNIHNLAGNVQEWVMDANRDVSRANTRKVKGGGWLFTKDRTERSYSTLVSIKTRERCLGFRCSIDPLPKGFSGY